MNDNRKQVIKIHQFLHGYDDGHRLLVGSRELDRQPAKTLLVMSDLAGQGEGPGEDGYLTGYPLSGDGTYALTRTWLAPEMSRPGCVWSHTILIDFSDLANIYNPSFLNLFRHPSPHIDNNIYSTPIQFKPCDQTFLKSSFPVSAMAVLLDAVYNSPNAKIFFRASENLPIENITLALWLQQWPRLRRTFRFCTWAPSDRSRQNEIFDLQFVPYDKITNGRNLGKKGEKWINLLHSSPEESETWALKAAKDAKSESVNSSLQKFLSMYGAKATAGRADFKPLALVWHALEERNNVDLGAAIIAVNNMHPSIDILSLRIVKEIISLSLSSNLPSAAIEYLLLHLSLLGEWLNDAETKTIAGLMWNQAPDQVWPLFNSNSAVLKSIANFSAKVMTPEEALTNSGRKTDLFCAALNANTNLAASPLVWDAPNPIPKRTVEILSNSDDLDKEILHSMFEAENNDVPTMGIALFGQEAITTAVEFYDSSNRNKTQDKVSKWLMAAKKHPDFIMTAIAQCAVRNIGTLAFLATLVKYNAPSVSKGKDEWAKALASLKDDIEGGYLDFYVFLMRRALSGASKNPGTLIQKSFDPLHNALIQSKLKKDTWALLEGVFPKIIWWNNWDRAHRVRLGAVEAFVCYGLPPRDFLMVTKNNKTFKNLIGIAVLSPAGFAYIEQVSLWAAKSDSDEIVRRGLIIDKILKQFK